jgi:hypothetical protein
MDGLILDGVLTVEKFLRSSDVIEFKTHTYDLSVLDMHISLHYHEPENLYCKIRHKFIGRYVTDIKLINTSNIAQVTIYTCHIGITNTFIKYNLSSPSIDILDFQGVYALGNGAFISYTCINKNEPVSGTLSYRELDPMYYMGDIETDILFGLLRHGQIIGYQDGKIYTDYKADSLEKLHWYAYHAYNSARLMYKWPELVYTINTDNPDIFRLPWITWLSSNRNTLKFQIKSENLARLEQLMISNGRIWPMDPLSGVVDKELTDQVNKQYEDFHRPRIARYNQEKETEPQFMPYGSNLELREQYNRDVEQLEQIKKNFIQQNPTKPQYLINMCTHNNAKQDGAKRDGSEEVLF